MMEALIVTLAGAITLAVIAYRASRKRIWVAEENMPYELTGASLYASEREYRTRTPVPLRGVVDQVYCTAGDYLVPVETKRRTHARVYPSDSLQLSAQALLLRRRRFWWLSRAKVADHGYVRLVTDRGISYQRVELSAKATIIDAYRRYCDVRTGQVEPHAATSLGLCRKCAYRTHCPHPTQHTHTNRENHGRPAHQVRRVANGRH